MKKIVMIFCQRFILNTENFRFKKVLNSSMPNFVSTTADF